MHLPQYILEVQEIYEQNGYEVFVVGGCVRDALCNRQCHDYDVITNATPQVSIQLFKQKNMLVVPTGLKHGTISLFIDNHPIEITTYRKEGAYEDHRRPTSVTFTSNVEEDLKRRDFTMNAIAYHPNVGIVDPFGGKEDIENKIIRCVGDPKKRFEEDALRIMRCLRFAMELNFTIESNTYAALKQNIHLLKHIAKERIKDELGKMLLSDYQDMLLLLKDSGVLDIIIPEYQMTYDLPQETPYHIYDVFHHMNAVLNSASNTTLPIKLALLLHDLEKRNYKTIDEKGVAHFKQHAHASALLSKQILRRLKFDNKTIRKVFLYIDYHDYYLSTSRKVIRRFLYKLHGDFDLAYAIMDVQKYDNLGKNPAIIQEKNQIIDDVVVIMKEMQTHKECFHIKDLAINGKDLITLGYEGKEIKVALDHLLLHILNQQEKNNKAYLMNYAGGHKHEIINR